MLITSLFPTQICSGRLASGNRDELNRQLLRECRQLRLDDAAGRRWSDANYPGGYTSYASANRMHKMSPTFGRLERQLAPHLARYVRRLALDMRGRTLSMTDCWVNIMPRRVAHGSHLHPLSTISGTYYVQTPQGCPGLKFEDPRLARMMAAPPRRRSAAASSQPWVAMPAQAGGFFLFESWLRHEVAPNPARGERISISFNYSWF
ncbi:MAG: TIGR02466 family protein [Steroidobacterales bacterium]